ncbi:hypothetical protein Dvina_24875 [Dactylosporangium vinaceum]|uniref:Secreted protein n=1 Tax=Dactylosporangium vinaceum TaxID=53362 RepID=A0ABV5ME03_9ACTN|nr:hypothetical protein [Dactylosporangium vinaceum]UAC00999.1 hypothetical protein Dvina_24875 [Dactylosporangium vinaceum]
MAFRLRGRDDAVVDLVSALTSVLGLVAAAAGGAAAYRVLRRRSGIGRLHRTALRERVDVETVMRSLQDFLREYPSLSGLEAHIRSQLYTMNDDSVRIRSEALYSELQAPPRSVQRLRRFVTAHADHGGVYRLAVPLAVSLSSWWDPDAALVEVLDALAVSAAAVADAERQAVGRG